MEAKLNPRAQGARQTAARRRSGANEKMHDMRKTPHHEEFHFRGGAANAGLKSNLYDHLSASNERGLFHTRRAFWSFV